jgi:hypothetical protein
MGGLFSNPPPTDGSSLPSIPIPDFVTTGQSVAEGFKAAGWWDDFIAKWHASKLGGLDAVWSFAISTMDYLLGLTAKLFTSIQGTNTPGFFFLIAALVEDILGVPVDQPTIQAAFIKGGNFGAMRSLGQPFFNLFQNMLAPAGSSLQASDGIPNAEKFMAYLIEYSIREGNQEFVSELIPEEFNPFGGIKGYGQNMAHNFGFSRLARQAFQPLMKLLIAEPLTRSLNASYKPAILSEAQYARAYVRGQMDKSTVTQNLYELGFNDDLQSIILTENTKALAVHELVNYLRTVDTSGSVPTAALQLIGYSGLDAPNLWAATIEGLVDPLRKQYLNELTRELRAGEIDYPTASQFLSTLNLFPQEAGWYTQIWQQMLTAPRKRLSESEMERAYLEGLVDLFAMQSYWARSGYSLQDMQTLQLLLLQKQQGGTKTTSGRVSRKVLSEAEIEKAVKAGIITLTQAQAYWTLHGYSAVDVAILSELVGSALGQPITPVSGTPT